MTDKTKPNEELNLLEIMSRDLTTALRVTGLPVRENVSFGSGRLQATFIPRARQTNPKKECPACKWTSRIDHLGRCVACWGDVFGLCEKCKGILEEDGSCPVCQLKGAVR
jgi:hypothetical protein